MCGGPALIVTAALLVSDPARASGDRLALVGPDGRNTSKTEEERL
jgi:hypothetical protein